MTVNDLRQKYIGKSFLVKADGSFGKCIQVNGYKKDDAVKIRFCLYLNGKGTWFSSDEIEPLKETLF